MSKKEQSKRIEQLEQEVRDLQSYMGVLMPVIEKEYRKGGWDFSKE